MGGWALDINGDPAQLWSSSEADIKKSSNFIGYKNPEADKLIAAGKLPAGYGHLTKEQVDEMEKNGETIQ